MVGMAEPGRMVCSLPAVIIRIYVHFRVAIIGDFSKYTSKSLKDFIRESNRGNMIFFVEDLQSAMLRL